MGLKITHENGTVTDSGEAKAAKQEAPAPVNPAGVISDRDLYWNEDKTKVLEEGDPDVRFVFCGKGSTVSHEDVAKYGLRFGDGEAETASKPSVAASESSQDEPGKGEAGEGEAGTSDDSEDLEALTVVELRELAKKESIDLAGVTLKADIIAAIQLGREGG